MKETFNQINTQNESLNIQTFREYFPDSEIREISISDVPQNVMEFFENKSRLFIPPKDYKPKNFKTFFIIKIPNNDLIYTANQTKTYNTNEGKDVEESTYFFETREDQKIGHSELLFNISSDIEHLKNKPFIGFTNTEEDYREKGLGTRRIKLMNAISLSLYNEPLYSSTNISNQEERLWEKLAEKGEAEKFKEGEYDRYRMTI